MNSLWKMEKLFVTQDGKLPGRSITEDIDPTYFTIVSGRPIKGKKNIREYLKEIRECFLSRLKVGYYLDEILLIDERTIKERKRFEEGSSNFLSNHKGFEAFLTDDHQKSWELMETAKQEKEKCKQKMETINELKKELKDAEAGVLVLEEKWRTYRMFQKFLYIIAPSEWRKIHDPYLGEKDIGVTASDPCLFDSFRDFPGDKKIDLEVKILNFKEDLKKSQPPELYFTDPQQLQNILGDLEKNNLRALAHCRELDFPVEKIRAELEKVIIQFQETQKSLNNEIKFIRELVTAEEGKWNINQKELRNIVYGLFRDLITNEEYLTIISCVENVYEDVMIPNDSNVDMITMIKEIEMQHENLLLALDLLPGDLMTKSTRQFYKEQRRTLREAKEAEKKVRQMELLLKRLSQSLIPGKEGAKERKLVTRSLPPEEFMFRIQMPKLLSKEGREELFFYGNTPEDVKIFKPLWA